MTVRKHMFFSGQVQGVGFRYRSYDLAQSQGLTGWVKNLWDDRVEMEVQGEEGRIDLFVDQLAHQRFIRIEAIEAEDCPLKEGENCFKIVGS